MILQYLKKKENKDKVIAKNQYENVLKISNDLLNNYPYFIDKNYKVSFEIVTILIIFHIIRNKLRFEKKDYLKINENIISLFVLDLDESLRSKGIGDMSIGKYVKSYVKKFYFRLKIFPLNINKNGQQDFIRYFELFDFVIKSEHLNASNLFIDRYMEVIDN